MSNQIENIKSTIEFPETVRKSNTGENTKFYYKTIKDSPVKAKYLFVAVKYLNGYGHIITAFYTNKIKGENAK